MLKNTIVCHYSDLQVAIAFFGWLYCALKDTLISSEAVDDCGSVVIYFSSMTVSSTEYSD